MSKKIWSCKIGETSDPLPDGADSPMRSAIEQAYLNLTGRYPEFIFSGWGAKLTEGERAVIENREPYNGTINSYEELAAHYEALCTAQQDRIDKLQAFKDYVHQRLDEAGIPTHPDGSHSKEGCRVGDRLDLLIKKPSPQGCTDTYIVPGPGEYTTDAAPCGRPAMHRGRCGPGPE